MYGLMGLWQDAQNERNMNRMLLMGERITLQGNALKSSVTRRCSMLLNSKSYTSYKLQHGSKQVGPIIFYIPTDGRTSKLY